MTDRKYWVETLLKISRPIFVALSKDRLKEVMPVETTGNIEERKEFTHLEALGRSFAGIAPWLNIKAESESEEKERLELKELVKKSLTIATNPASKDFMNFDSGFQPIVDTSFLATGLLRSWESIWLELDLKTQQNIIQCCKATRSRKPTFNNWLLFSAIIETFLYKAGEEYDSMRIDYALKQHEEWYVGDGFYSDGPTFKADYYNSFVIHPMLYDIINNVGHLYDSWEKLREPISERIVRYSVISERFISPDGFFPPIGRSLAYRFGAFQALALVALENKLPKQIPPSSIRGALTAVIKKVMTQDGTFDKNGWLRIGFCGNQKSIGEKYISTGSLYLCLCGLLPLGLKESHPFWSDESLDWTSKKIWNGEDIESIYKLYH